jgi:DNA-binding MarR family transcriptional regulator
VRPKRQGGFLLGRVHQAGRRVFAGILKRHGIRLRPQQGRILFVLWREGAMPMGELAARTSLGKSTLTPMVDRLEAEGLLQRAASPHDRRVTLIEPSAPDPATKSALAKASEEMTRVYYAGFRSGEIDRFEADLKRILDNLTDEEEKG